MSKLQEIFERIQKTKKDQKEIKAMYKDALKNSSKYQEVLEELDALKAKKKEIEAAVKEDFSKEFDKLEVLKNDLTNDKQLLADAAMSKVAKGEKVEITDANNTQYEPIFSVKFKKIA